jgi:hypothetical protein
MRVLPPAFLQNAMRLIIKNSPAARPTLGSDTRAPASLFKAFFQHLKSDAPSGEMQIARQGVVLV